MGGIAKTWRELSGKSKWKGLLEPLNIDLRKYLLHYGQFAQATYDGFNFEKASKYAGNCRYSKKDFFSKVYLEEGNPYKYSVTKYLYATSKASDSAAFLLTSIFSKDAWSMESNWIWGTLLLPLTKVMLKSMIKIETKIEGKLII